MEIRGRASDKQRKSKLRTEEQVNVLLAVKDDFAKNSSFLFLDEGFLDLCSEKSS